MRSNLKLERMVVKSLILYFYLVMILALVVMILFFNLSRFAKVQLVFLGAMGYLLTAFVYHYLDKTLTVRVIIEYILLALVAVVAISTFI